MKSRLFTYTRWGQLICGFAVFLMGLWIWWRIFLLGPSNEKKFGSEDTWLVLMIVAPGVFVVLGSLLQAAYRKIWPTALVLLGSAVALWFIGLFAQFLFGYIGDRVALRMVYADLALLMITVAASLLNAFVEWVLYLSKTRAEQVS